MPLLNIIGPGLRYYASAGADFIESAIHPLELILPRAAGTNSTDDLSAGELTDVWNQNTRLQTAGVDDITTENRIFKAYPGIEYNIRAQVIGGAIPYTFSLSGEPAGMIIDSATGEITWPSPTGTTESPTLTVTDAEGVVRSSGWTITITTSGFYFIDAVNGNDTTGAGTLAAPWATFAKIFNDVTDADGVVYVRSGNYGPSGVTNRENPDAINDAIGFAAGTPCIWIAYPGDAQPVYDAGRGAFSTHGCTLNLSHNNNWIDGLRITNQSNMLIHKFGGSYCTIRRNLFDTIPTPTGGANPAAIMMASHAYSWYDYYLCVQDNSVTDIGTVSGIAGLLRAYSKKKYLIEGNHAYGNVWGLGELKAAVVRGEVRYNKATMTNDVLNPVSTEGNLLGGNFDEQTPGESCRTEIRGNYFGVSSAANCVFKLGSSANPAFVIRNTMHGLPWSEGMDDEFGTGKNHYYRRNFIVNDYTTYDEGVTVTGASSDPTSNRVVPTPDRVEITDNVRAGTADSAINTTTGEPQGSYLTQYGPSTATPRGCIPSLLP